MPISAFLNSWEQCKLGDFGEIITGNTPSTNVKDYWSEDGNGLVWITPTDINSPKTYNSERKLTLKGELQARVIPKNCVLVTCIASIGKNTINQVPCAFNQQINAIVPRNSNSYYIYSMLNNMTHEFQCVAGTSATPIINKKEFTLIKTLSPYKEEQCMIGSIFELIDNLITHHQ